MLSLNSEFRIVLVGIVCSACAPTTFAEEKPAGRVAQVQTDTGTPRTVRVAGIVLKWLRLDKEGNYRRAEALIREAAAKGAQIVVTTETFLDGLAYQDKTLPIQLYRSMGEAIPGGKYYQRLAALADELDIYLVAAMTEADGEHCYNAAALIGPHGNLVGKYRKQVLDQKIEVRNTPGNESTVFDTPLGRVGLFICSDRGRPETVKGFCDKGAQILLCPSGGNYGGEWNDELLQQRSRETVSTSSSSILWSSWSPRRTDPS